VTTTTTVLMTCFNAASTVGTALESLRGHDVGPDQVVVVDDGSTDDTVAAVRRHAGDLPLTLVARARRGRAAALNVGVVAATSDLVAILDADDAAVPGRFALQQRAFDDDPTLGIHGGAFFQLTRHPEIQVQRRTLPLTDRAIRRALAFQGPFCHSCVTYSRAALVEAGGFRPGLPSRIDQDLWVRIAGLGYTLANSPEALACHVKDAATYFGSVNKTLTRTATMLSRNVAAVRQLHLPAKFYAIAAGRAAASIVPQRIMHRAAPGLDPVSWEEFEQTMGVGVAAGLRAGITGLSTAPSLASAGRR
jgi:glycosyltransferase involved in cell wall biosynthesis